MPLWWLISSKLKLGRSLQDPSTEGKWLLECLELSLFFPHSPFSIRLHSVNPLLPSGCPQSETALKNSHRWRYTLPVSVTHCSPHPAVHHPSSLPVCLPYSCGSLGPCSAAGCILLNRSIRSTDTQHHPSPDQATTPDQATPDWACLPSQLPPYLLTQHYTALLYLYSTPT